MSIKYLIQLGLSFSLLLLSTMFAWYEGSRILDDPWEWKYTAIFSQMVNGDVAKASEILPIDHIVYAAKFLPVFPLIMLCSGTYLIVLLGYILLKSYQRMFSYFLLFFGVLFLILSSFIAQSPTSGLTLIFFFLITIGMGFILVFTVMTARLSRLRIFQIK